MQVGRKKTREFLVIWHEYPLEEATWIPEQNFPYPNELHKMIKHDKLVEDVGSGSGV